MISVAISFRTVNPNLCPANFSVLHSNILSLSLKSLHVNYYSYYRSFLHSFFMYCSAGIHSALIISISQTTLRDYAYALFATDFTIKLSPLEFRTIVIAKSTKVAFLAAFGYTLKRLSTNRAIWKYSCFKTSFRITSFLLFSPMYSFNKDVSIS